MKKISVILLALAIIAIPSCKNQNNKKQAEDVATHEISEKEQLVAEELKVNLQNLIESTKQMMAVPFIYSENGAVQFRPGVVAEMRNTVSAPPSGNVLPTGKAALSVFLKYFNRVC